MQESYIALAVPICRVNLEYALEPYLDYFGFYAEGLRHNGGGFPGFGMGGGRDSYGGNNWGNKWAQTTGAHCRFIPNKFYDLEEGTNYPQGYRR